MSVSAITEIIFADGNLTLSFSPLLTDDKAIAGWNMNKENIKRQQLKIIEIIRRNTPNATIKTDGNYGRHLEILHNNKIFRYNMNAFSNSLTRSR